MLWLWTLTSPMILTLDFQGKILKLLYLRNGRVDSLGMKRMWVGYDVGCHGAWKIDRRSNGSMLNSYSFQPVGPWMGYSFTDLGAEVCCHSLNALLQVLHSRRSIYDVGSLVYSVVGIKSCAFLAVTKQLYEWFSPSVCHTFLTMLPSSYHHEIFRSYYQWQKWRPCKRSRSEVKGQGHGGQHPT